MLQSTPARALRLQLGSLQAPSRLELKARLLPAGLAGAQTGGLTSEKLPLLTPSGVWRRPGQGSRRISEAGVRRETS